jgi:4-amino-4-deoxy-L-arabinose transferase-like glycosyltransferase
VERSDIQRWLPAAAILAGAALLLLCLSTYGIWVPWEVEVAELARRFDAGEAVELPSIGPWLVAQSVQLFGLHEWSARLPIALAGFATIALAWHLVATFADRRAANYAALIAATSPLFIFNAGTMLGEAPSFAVQAAIAHSALLSVFGKDARTRGVWLVFTIVLCGLGVAARGALLCSLPPLAAAAVVASLEGPLSQPRENKGAALNAAVLWLLTLGLLGLCTLDVIADRPGLSLWLGGAPQGGQPPSFDAVIERVFHTFAPWSALLPLALGRMVGAPAGGAEFERPERALRLFVVLWAAFGYATLTVFLSRYGQRAAYVPLVALAAAVALFLRDIERSRVNQWPAAIAVVLLALLILRDYALYPSSPLRGLPLAEISLPATFNPKTAWALVLILFSAVAGWVLGPDPERTPALRLGAPYAWLRGQWRRGLAFQLWLVVFGLALLGGAVFGGLSFIPAIADRLTTLGMKLGRASMLVPVALPVALAAGQLALYTQAMLRDRRVLPILLAGACVGAYAAFGFMPALGAQLSPRDLYETYNRLARPGETLAEYRVGSRAARYYAKGKPLEVDTLAALVDHLAVEPRRWATFPGEELAEVDRSFRERTGRHIFVADARNDRALLGTNHAIAGRTDQNVLTTHVLSGSPPTIERPVSVNFDDKIEMLGYALKLPHTDHVGQGDHFSIVWYFKALRQVPGNYRIFVHIDAPGARVGGDHDPIGGKYPVRLWRPGDIIVDEQRIHVPANTASGTYTIFVGFYSGDTRLPIKEGARDDVNRANAGVLRIR